MKIYTAEFDADTPAAQAVTVPANSTFGVAVGVKYRGEPVRLKQHEITVDGLSANDMLADDRYALFTLSSDSSTGVESRTVASVVEGMTVKDLSVYALADYVVDGAGYKTLSGDITNWGGETITFEQWASWGQRSDGRQTRGGQVYFYTSLSNIQDPHSCLGWTQLFQQLHGPSISAFGVFVDADTQLTGMAETLTLPTDTPLYYAYWANLSEVKCKYWIDASATEKINRRFPLLIHKADKGIIDGYGDMDKVKRTVNLSGTYADGNDFSFTIPAQG